MGGLDEGLTGLYRPGGRAAGLRKGYAETGHEQVGEEGDEQEACPKARVATRCYRPGCSQTSSGPYTCPEWCGMTPVSNALKGKSILVMLESIIPTASKRRPPRRRSTRPSPPLGLRAAAPRQRAAGGDERTADPRRSRIERHAAHARKWESGGRASSAGDGGMSGAVGTLTMRRLQAPSRHKPGI